MVYEKTTSLSPYVYTNDVVSECASVLSTLTV